MFHTNTDLLDRLNRCLTKFKAITVNDITEKYAFYPTPASSNLGSGTYGDVFRMKAIDGQSPPRVVKVIPKSKACKNAISIQHVCVELAVTSALSHPNLNHRVALFQSDSVFYIVLELCEGRKPDVASRLYHVFANDAPQKLALVPDLISAHTAAVGATGDDDAVVNSVLKEAGLKSEVPLGTDLFNAIVRHKKIAPRKALIILKQILEGLAYMHEKNVVHRDIKPENVVAAEDRTATPIIEGGNIVGVRITEKIRAKIIDFGLAKYMQVTQFPTTPSPRTFGEEPSVWNNAPPIDQLEDVSFTFAGNKSANATALIAAIAAVLGVPSSSISIVSSAQGVVVLRFPNASVAAVASSNATIQYPAIAALGVVVVIQPVMVTPGGTEIYYPLEVINGILLTGSKWHSNTQTLPKFDVYGAGAIMFCMCHGRQPYQMPATNRSTTKEEKLRKIAQLLEHGPVFSDRCPADVKKIIAWLMTNEPKNRPKAIDALRDDVFKGVTDTYTYEVYTDGRFKEIDDTVVAATSKDAAPPATAVDSSLVEGDVNAVAEDITIADIMEVKRGQEDKGDGAGKDASEAPSTAQ